MSNDQINAALHDAMAFRMLWDAGLAWANMLISGAWLNKSGCLILRRWTGGRYPIPLAPTAVGFAQRPATTVASDAAAVYANNTIYHHRVDVVSAGGVLRESDPMFVQTAVWVSGHVGLIPNAPSGVTLRQISGPAAVLSWFYDPAGQQVEPARFTIHTDSGTGTMDWITAIATVVYVPGVNYYTWTSGVLASGDRQFGVRAETAGAVKSLIPSGAGGEGGVAGSYSSGLGFKGKFATVAIDDPAAPEFV